MALGSLDEVLTAIQTQDIDALVAEDPRILHELLSDKGTLEAAAGVDGDVVRVRHLLYTAWFWASTNKELGKTGVPQVVKDNLDRKPTVVDDPLAGTYGII